MANKEIKIGNYIVNETSCPYMIAEIGINHNGDIEIAKKLNVTLSKLTVKILFWNKLKSNIGIFACISSFTARVCTWASRLAVVTTNPQGTFVSN